MFLKKGNRGQPELTIRWGSEDASKKNLQLFATMFPVAEFCSVYHVDPIPINTVLRELTSLREATFGERLFSERMFSDAMSSPEADFTTPLSALAGRTSLAKTSLFLHDVYCYPCETLNPAVLSFNDNDTVAGPYRSLLEYFYSPPLTGRLRLMGCFGCLPNEYPTTRLLTGYGKSRALICHCRGCQECRSPIEEEPRSQDESSNRSISVSEISASVSVWSTGSNGSIPQTQILSSRSDLVGF